MDGALASPMQTHLWRPATASHEYMRHLLHLIASVIIHRLIGRFQMPRPDSAPHFVSVSEDIIW